jgi:hypothetical protein
MRKDFPDTAECDKLNNKGIHILRMDLVNSGNNTLIAEKKLIPILLSLA